MWRLAFQVIGFSFFLCAHAASGDEDERAFEPGEKIRVAVSGLDVAEQGMVYGGYTIGADGRIEIPAFGEDGVPVGGLTPVEAEALLDRLYAENGGRGRPTFVVRRDALAVPTVTVIGEVERAGVVELREGMTVEDAVRECGVDEDLGRWTKLRLIRGGEVQRVFWNTVLAADDKVMVRDMRWLQLVIGGVGVLLVWALFFLWRQVRRRSGVV